MVIIKLIGGLGNQMFQYSAGRRLAHVLGVDLKLDLAWFSESKVRTYALDLLKIKAIPASQEEVLSLTAANRNFFSKEIQKIFHLQPTPSITHIQEKHPRFDPAVLVLPNNVYLDGYWQSEKYFKEIENLIREELTFRSPLIGINLSLAESMKQCDSVSLHIRRGDYVQNHETVRFYGLCSLDYYQSAVAWLTQRIVDPHFYIFSDEPQWATDHLKLEYPQTIIDHNGSENAHEDLRLMSHCKHHITANSSFSWWGAWLDPNPHKTVIAPKHWFQNPKFHSEDLIPSEWMRL